MPYNLRKRAQPEPVAVVAAPKPAAKKRKAPVEPVAAEPKAKKTPVKPKVEPKAQAKEKKEEVKEKKAEVKAKKVEVKEKKVEVKENKAEVKEEEKHEEVEEDEQELVEPPKKKIATSTTTKGQYSFGSDTCGELGLGKIGMDKSKPTRVPIEEPIKQVACGPMHAITLTDTGVVLTYGCNDEGALGRVTDGDEKLEATPTEVPLPSKGIKVTAGDSHSAVLTDNQQVYIWGNFRDEHGGVGLTPEGDQKPTLKPIKLMPEVKFQDIASGSNHMLLLDVDGVVYSFGVGEQGQLGRLDHAQVDKVEITGENRELFLKPQKVNLKEVDPQRPFICDAVYAGNFSSFATNTDKKKNRLAGWGLNNNYQLGYKGQKGELVQYKPKRSTFTCSTSMINVACGQHHTLFLTKTGRVYSAGKHLYGMLGLGKSVNKEVCPAKYVETLGNSVIDISAGISTSFAVSDNGKLYAWGMGGTNLGFKNEEDLFVPTEVKSLDGLAVKSVSAGASFTSVIVG